MNSTLLYMAATIGTGLKFGPIAIIDEIGCFFYALLKLYKGKVSIKFNIYNITIFYFFFSSLFGLYYGNINSLRYMLIPACLLLIQNDVYNINYKYVKIAAYFYLLSNLTFSSSFFSYLGTAWWQDWLWTGTAYSSIAIFFSASILILFTKKNIQKFIIIIIFFLIAIFTDSRYLALLGIFLLFFLISYFLHFRKYMMIVWLTILILFSYNISFTFSNVSKSLISTLNDIIIQKNESRDSDRRENIAVVFSMYEKNKIHFLFGHGTLSHQYDLSEYLPASKDGRVRPTGVPAIIFDGGIVLFILLISCIIKSIFFYFKQARIFKIPFYLFSLCLIFPFVAFISIFITNPIEMILWWLLFLPGSIGHIIIYQYSRQKIV